MRLVVLGHHHEAGRAAVEPVHDAGAQHAAHPGEVAHVVQQRVDERPRQPARSRMDGQARRLVQDEKTGVFVARR